jgi:hypothetical protein
MSMSESKEEEIALTTATQTQQPLSMADLLVAVAQLTRQQQEDRKQQEEDRKLLQDLLIQATASLPPHRRDTMYMPETPQRVSERTSMGGATNMRSPTSGASEHGHNGSGAGLNMHAPDQHLSKTTTMKVKEPPVFGGDPGTDVVRWLELMEDFMSCFSESEIMKVQKVMLYLGEGPRQYVKTAEDEAKSESRQFIWKDVKKILLECFLPAITEDIARTRLASLKQSGTVWEYTAEFQKLDRYIVNSSTADRIERYKRGLKDQIQRLWLQQFTLQSVAIATTTSANGETRSAPIISKLTQAISYASQLEANIERYRELAKPTYRPVYSYQYGDRRKAVGVNQILLQDDLGAGMPNVEDAWDDPPQRNRVENVNQVSSSPAPLRRPRPVRYSAMSEEKYERLMKEGKCLICEQAGHRRAECPKKPSGNVSATNAHTTSSSVTTSKKEEAPRQK